MPVAGRGQLSMLVGAEGLAGHLGHTVRWLCQLSTPRAMRDTGAWWGGCGSGLLVPTEFVYP